jgi:hypothetical protein
MDPSHFAPVIASATPVVDKSAKTHTIITATSNDGPT